jgi:2'-5' RNA ligase
VSFFKKSTISYKNGRVDADAIREPTFTNFYLSLQTTDRGFLEIVQLLTHKLSLQNPNTIQKKPNQYHITLADLHGIEINDSLLEKINDSLINLPPLIINGELQKPIVDEKKQKVVFWLHLKNNPFIITLQFLISSFIPRKTEKKFVPHVTLLKILKTTAYNQQYKDLKTNLTANFDKIVITANIDDQKEVVLFEKEI